MKFEGIVSWTFLILFNSENLSALKAKDDNRYDEFNPCLSSPCQHGGSCVNYGDSFTCQCKPGYRGIYCEHDSVVLSDEKRLIKKLLEDYDHVGIVGRPVHNTSQTIKVGYGLSLIQILDLDEKNQILTTNVWSRYKWNDMLLQWNMSEFGGIDLVRIPTDKIWTPDIVLYNYADTRLKEQRETLSLVYSNGDVEWMPPSIFKSTCQIDITNFPFDNQVCTLKFGSWTYDGTKLDIVLHEGGPVHLADYMTSKEWDLIGMPAVRNIKFYQGLDMPYLDVSFTINIKRVAMFYSYILVLPCVLLSLLTLVIFWLPPESPAKVMLGMSIFVAFFVLLLLLSESTPPAASRIPLIGQYFCMNMVLITLSTFLAVIIIQTHIRGDRKNKVPPWLRRIAIDGLARVLCMDEYLDKEPAKAVAVDRQGQPVNDGERNQKQKLSRKSSGSGVLGGGSVSGGKSNLETSSQHNRGSLSSHHQLFDHQHMYYGQQGGLGVGPSGGLGPGMHGSLRDVSGGPPQVPPERTPVRLNPALESDIREIRRMMRAYINRLENKDAQAKNAKEWRLVARVLDRLFFFSYLATIAVSLTTTFPKDITPELEGTTPGGQ